LKRYHETTALQIILLYLFTRGKYVHAPAVLTALQNITIIIIIITILKKEDKNK